MHNTTLQNVHKIGEMTLSGIAHVVSWFESYALPHFEFICCSI